MEKNTNELVLEELLKLNNKFDGLSVKIDVIDRRVSTLETRMEDGFRDIAESFKNMGGMITYIGDKVFDNHERRIKAIETA